MFQKRRKEENLISFTEEQVQEKLYGCLHRRTLPEHKAIEGKEEKNEIPQNTKTDTGSSQIKPNAPRGRKILKASPIAEDYIKNKILPKEKDSASKTNQVFWQSINFKLFIAAVIAVTFCFHAAAHKRNKKSVIVFKTAEAVKQKSVLEQQKRGTKDLLKKSSEQPQKEIIPSGEQSIPAPASASFYTIQVCVYEKEAEAQRLVNEWKKKNFDSFIYPAKSKTKTKYRVCIGKFTSKENALKTYEDLKKDFKDSFVRLVTLEP